MQEIFGAYVLNQVAQGLKGPLTQDPPAGRSFTEPKPQPPTPQVSTSDTAINYLREFSHERYPDKYGEYDQIVENGLEQTLVDTTSVLITNSTSSNGQHTRPGHIRAFLHIVRGFMPSHPNGHSLTPLQETSLNSVTQIITALPKMFPHQHEIIIKLASQAACDFGTFRPSIVNTAASASGSQYPAMIAARQNGQ